MLVSDTDIHSGPQMIRIASQVDPKFIVTGLQTDAEMVSCLHLLLSLIQQITLQEALMIRSETDIDMASATHLVVILAAGLLEDELFAKTMLCASSISLLTVVTDLGFPFPPPEFYEKLETGSHEITGIHCSALPDLAAAYRRLCKVLAFPITPRGSESLLQKQVEDICQRLTSSEDVTIIQARANKTIASKTLTLSVVAC